MMDNNIQRIARRIIGTADSYFVGEMFLPGLRTNPRYENLMGRIVIGGDRGDVWAASAYADERDGEEGVVLVDVEFKTTLDFSDADPDRPRDEAEEVIQASYASIQEDTFAPTTRRGSAGCDQCEALSINGVATHETGCPNSHLDPATGQPHQTECAWCGSECDQPARGKPFCDESCAESYNS